MDNYLLPRLRDVLFLCIFLAVLLLGPRMLNADGDLPRHILMGRIILESGSIPTTDVFSHVVQGAPLVPHEWLAGVVFHLIHSMLGLEGVLLLAALLLALAFTMIYEESLRGSQQRLAALALTAWGAAVSSLHWITRPHLFTMLFFALYLIWANRLQQGELKHTWRFPMTMALWANLHGEFIAGLLVLGAYGAGWVWDRLFAVLKPPVKTGKQLALAFFSSLLVTLINPVGLHAWETVTGYINNRYLMSRIHETNPPDFTQAPFLVLLALLGTSIFLLATQKERLSSGQAFALAGFSIMSLLSARNVHLYGVAAPLLLASTLAGRQLPSLIQKIESLLARVEISLRGWAWPLVTTLLVGSLLISGVFGSQNRFAPAKFPVQAVDWLEENPQQGKMFNAFDWGGYLLLRLWPEQLAFIDSQTDVHGQVTREYETVITLADGWQATLEQRQVQWAILPPDWPLAQALLAEGWHQVYRDDTATILVQGDVQK